VLDALLLKKKWKIGDHLPLKEQSKDYYLLYTAQGAERSAHVCWFFSSRGW
jgi:hypothetical protein